MRPCSSAEKPRLRKQLCSTGPEVKLVEREALAPSIRWSETVLFEAGTWARSDSFRFWRAAQMKILAFVTEPYWEMVPVATEPMTRMLRFAASFASVVTR